MSPVLNHKNIMRAFCILFILAFVCLKAQTPDTTVKNRISGKLVSHSVYHGGIDRDDSQIPQVPMPGYRLCLILWKGEHQIPVVVKNLTTDENGEFHVIVPPGKYGFATPQEVDSLTTGQWLPRATETWAAHTLTNTYWQISTGSPVDATQSSVSNVVLVYHHDSTCMDCP
jgi:hypothetical protein